MLSILNLLVVMYPYGSLGVPLVPKSHDTLQCIGRIIQIYKTSWICGEKYGAFCSISKISLKSLYSVSWLFWCLALQGINNKKKGESVEDIKFSVDTQLNFIFSTFSPTFCCLSARGLEVSLHFWQSWPTVRRTVFRLNWIIHIHKGQV